MTLTKGFTGGLIQDPDMFKIPEYRLAQRTGLEDFANFWFTISQQDQMEIQIL